MKATHFRAYGKAEAISRRDTSEGKQNLAHDVHHVVAEGTLKDGVGSFSTKAEVAYVAFYSGPEGDDQVCVGRVDGPFPAGKVSIDASDIPEEPEFIEAAAGEVLVDGKTYRKID